MPSPLLLASLPALATARLRPAPAILSPPNLFFSASAHVPAWRARLDAHRLLPCTRQPSLHDVAHHGVYGPVRWR